MYSSSQIHFQRMPRPCCLKSLLVNKGISLIRKSSSPKQGPVVLAEAKTSPSINPENRLLKGSLHSFLCMKVSNQKEIKPPVVIPLPGSVRFPFSEELLQYSDNRVVNNHDLTTYTTTTTTDSRNAGVNQLL